MTSGLRFGLLAIAMLLGFAPSPARGWSGFGHELIAELAERQLSAETRAAALSLLGDEADSLASVAGWADQVRDLPEYRWSVPMHFVNFPRGECRYQPLRDCAGGACVVGAVQRFRAELADTSLPREQRVQALKFLVHFVGDIHQPLHCGYAHDRGGNTYQINVDGEGSNLHRVWDHFLLASHGRDRPAFLAALSAEPLPEAGDFDPVSWAENSCRIVGEEGFYPKRRKLGSAYFERFAPLADARMRLAAARLAATLEAAFAQR